MGVGDVTPFIDDAPAGVGLMKSAAEMTWLALRIVVKPIIFSKSNGGWE